LLNNNSDKSKTTNKNLYDTKSNTVAKY